jgi:hypothetical protein
MIFSSLTLAAKWVEYKFNKDYGNYFFDYSLNGRYGVNGNSNLDSKVISVDRGIFMKYGTSYITITKSGLFPSIFTVVFWVMAIDVGSSLFYFNDDSTKLEFIRGIDGMRIRMYVNDVVYTPSKEGSFPLSKR